MSSYKLTTVRFESGIWEAHVSFENEPQIEIRHLDVVLDGVEQTKAQDGWNLRITVPVSVLSEGVHCLVAFDMASGLQLGSLTIIAGEPAADDLRAEVELLRAELDMLKRAFRNHCANTD
ncbi:MAG: hypothetical protein ACR2O2_17210 [Ruegeria sp.]